MSGPEPCLLHLGCPSRHLPTARCTLLSVLPAESHYLKEGGSQRTKATVPLVKAIRRAILLSGTPALNKPKEIFQQVGAAGSSCKLCLPLMSRLHLICNRNFLGALKIEAIPQRTAQHALGRPRSACAAWLMPGPVCCACAAGGAGAQGTHQDDSVWRALLPGERALRLLAAAAGSCYGGPAASCFGFRLFTTCTARYCRCRATVLTSMGERPTFQSSMPF